MNSHRLPASRQTRPSADPIAYVTRRLSSILVVGAAMVAAVAAGLLESVGAPIPVALAVGVALFVAAATLVTSVAAGPAATSDAAGRASLSLGIGAWLRDLGQGSQLGPDPEQVIGRKTGART